MAADERKAALERWLAGVRPDVCGALTPASADASFRRYFRVPTEAGSLIAMDAPPAQEDSHAFVDIAARLERAGLHVPRVLASDIEQGFLLLSDLGTTGYLDRLDTEQADGLYREAIDALVRMQARADTTGLPEYDGDRLGAELDLFPAWYVQRHLGVEPGARWWDAWHAVRGRLIDSALGQPRVFVHRDFMPRNLMIASPNPGVLDFQDALAGPITYDPVCLLRDAFVSWPPETEDRWLEYYRGRAEHAGLPVCGDAARFRRDLDWMGVQRHLKVLGIFARLCHRDGKPHYIADAPRFLDYLAREVGPYPDLAPLRELLDALDGRACA